MIPQRKIVSNTGKMVLQPHLPPPPLTVSPPPPTFSPPPPTVSDSSSYCLRLLLLLSQPPPTVSLSPPTVSPPPPTVSPSFTSCLYIRFTGRYGIFLTNFFFLNETPVLTVQLNG